MGIKKIKIAIIGAGNMADEHLKSLSSYKNVKFVGIYNRSKSNAKKLIKKYKILDYYSDIKKMYKTTKADGVVVALSPDVLIQFSKKFLTILGNV